MRIPVFVMLFSISLLLQSTIYAQESDQVQNSKITIPAMTAYIHPSEETARVHDEGVTNWSDASEDVRFYFNIRTPGKLHIYLTLKTDGCKLDILFENKNYTLNIKKSADYQSIDLGEFTIKDTGFKSIVIKGLEKKGKVFANIRSLELSGSATKDMHFNAKERRNSASVHLSYPVQKNTSVEWFYNEIMVPDGMDPLHTYYMACGFNRGYFGIQVNSPTERRIIFSVWDSGDEAYERDKVPDSLRVHLIAKGKDVFSGDFGNEGTGGHSHLIYSWKTGQTYQFLVHALPQGSYTSYSGYFRVKGELDWNLISSWKAPNDGHYLSGLYSFVENFWGTNGDLLRKTCFANQWIRTSEGQWVELTKASFSYDATGHAGDRIDFAAGVENGIFYLSNGGFLPANIKYGDVIERPSVGKDSGINLPTFP